MQTPHAITLPKDFEDGIRPVVGEQAEAFFATFAEPRRRGIRINPAKITRDELESILGLKLTPLPWTKHGYVLPVDSPAGLGGHPAHLAGLFYLQDPSAMSVVTAMGLSPTWRVADLAAAPGGKATQILDAIGESGLLLAVESNPKRYRVLTENLDKWGARSSAAHQGRFERLIDSLVEPFDAVLLDAPCTGEALFRRDPRATREWSPKAVLGASRRQLTLLGEAARMVREGGTLVYSTCTFGRAENEDVIASFLAAVPGWEIERLPVDGLDPGLRTADVRTELTGRVWPHRAPGDGQYVARLRNVGCAPDLGSASAATAHGKHAARRPGGTGDTRVRRAWADFERDVMPGAGFDPDQLVTRGPNVFLKPAVRPNVLPGRLRRPGVFLGVARPGRFEPSHALAAMLDCSAVSQQERWAADDLRLLRYIQGEAIRETGPDGWVLICFDRWPLGWAKRSSGVLKNWFPRYLRAQAH